MRACAVLAAAAALVSGCGSTAGTPDLRADFEHGIAQIRTLRGMQLHDRLAATIARIRRDTGAGRALALQGFRSTLRGLEAENDLYTKDSGRLEGAVRDARRADRYLNRGAELLRAAGHVLGVRVGTLRGRW